MPYISITTNLRYDQLGDVKERGDRVLKLIEEYTGVPADDVVLMLNADSKVLWNGSIAPCAFINIVMPSLPEEERVKQLGNLITEKINEFHGIEKSRITVSFQLADVAHTTVGGVLLKDL